MSDEFEAHGRQKRYGKEGDGKDEQQSSLLSLPSHVLLERL